MLEDTVCIVCGGGNGIGEETAVAMADRGATVVVNDLGVDVTGGGADEEPAEETVDRIEDAGGEAMAHFGDVTDLEYTERLIEETAEEFGAVHSVVDYAGVLRDRMLFNMTESEWDAVIDVHLKGHFSLLHNAARHWRERAKAEDGLERERSFLCVSSDSAKGRIGQGNYAAAKAGVLGLMRTAAREIHQYDVRVNAFWPAALTRMTEDILDGVDEEAWGPHAVTGVPVFLASEGADGITGCTVGLRGGELSVVSDPEYERVLERDATSEGAWTAELVADRWDDLTEGYETDNSEPR